MNILNEACEIADYFLRKTRKRFCYPYISNQNDDYNITFSKRSKEYVKTIDFFPNDLGKYIKSRKEEIETLSNGLIEVINTYLKGCASEAYSKFDKLMNDRTYTLYKLSDKFPRDYKFYRARFTDNELTRREEIFHIPFNLRYLVNTQRFSIAGVPSLYLGKTIYSCWLELDKPNLNNVYISKFQVINDINVIDFTFNLELLKTMGHNVKNEKIEAFFELYPLILACGFKKKYSNSSFNAEYIIPSMLLQWISRAKENFDGLIYLSTKMTHLDMNSVGSNIVLPVKDISLDNSKKFCSILASKFKLTPPASWEILKTLKNSTLIIPNSISNKAKNNVNEILEKYYENTEFHKVEKIIDEYFQFIEINEK